MITTPESTGFEDVIRIKEKLGEEKNLHVISEEDLDNFIITLTELKAGTSFSEDSLTGTVDDADIIIVQSKNLDWGKNTLRHLKKQSNNFLKPVLLISTKPPEELQFLIDDSLQWPLTQDSFIESLEKLTNINQKLEMLEELAPSTNEFELKQVLLLRHLYSRETSTLKPQRNYTAKVGYTYPLANALFDVAPGVETQSLSILEEKKLLNFTIEDKVNLCPNCEHTHINYREICPHCKSLNIFEEATIHHFRCAHVGRESEYLHDGQLICPKCSRELRHIGVDYDKPSEILWCNSCNHNFSEPLLSCFCLACAHNFSPQDAFLENINEYTLSGEGMRAAEEGILPGLGITNILKKEVGFYNIQIFNELLQIELARCQRYKYESTLSKFNLGAAEKVFEKYKLLSSKRFRKDFAEIINQTFRTTDIFTSKTNGDILIIFTNTSLKNTKIAFQRLGELIQNQFDVVLKLKYKLFKLSDKGANLDDILEKMNDS